MAKVGEDGKWYCHRAMPWEGGLIGEHTMGDVALDNFTAAYGGVDFPQES